ncbi:hypothetical protein BH10ACT2_BH10ACT2_06040 [soil metagenome]
MVNSTAALLREALALPDLERADLAAELLASLDERVDDDPDAVSELWRQEFERRGKRALSSGAIGENWDKVRARLADELNG